MSTRSLIGYKTNNVFDNEYIRYAYVHCDGHPQNMLLKLKNYDNLEKVSNLVKLRSLRALYANIENCIPFDVPFNDECQVIYTSDANSFAELSKSIGCDFCYLFENNEWVWLNTN